MTDGIDDVYHFLFCVLCMTVRNSQPDDVADAAGKRVIQIQGHWLIPVNNPMEMRLQDIIRLLYPIMVLFVLTPGESNSTYQTMTDSIFCLCSVCFLHVGCSTPHV